jgi:gas vesicle protein
MILGIVIGFALGVAGGWLVAPLAGRELRSRAKAGAGKTSLGGALRRRDETVAGVRRRLQSAQQLVAEGTADGALEEAKAPLEGLAQATAAAANTAISGPSSLVDAIKQRLRETREATRRGYDEGVAEAQRLYETAQEV